MNVTTINKDSMYRESVPLVMEGGNGSRELTLVEMDEVYGGLTETQCVTDFSIAGGILGASAAAFGGVTAWSVWGGFVGGSLIGGMAGGSLCGYLVTTSC